MVTRVTLKIVMNKGPEFSIKVNICLSLIGKAALLETIFVLETD
jgi:hypothetical protein